MSRWFELHSGTDPADRAAIQGCLHFHTYPPLLPWGADQTALSGALYPSGRAGNYQLTFGPDRVLVLEPRPAGGGGVMGCVIL